MENNFKTRPGPPECMVRDFFEMRQNLNDIKYHYRKDSSDLLKMDRDSEKKEEK